MPEPIEEPMKSSGDEGETWVVKWKTSKLGSAAVTSIASHHPVCFNLLSLVFKIV
jgi:hypothetical protein